MNFRGKQWERDGNHYSLVGTKIRVYFWNTGKNQTYLVENIGARYGQQNTYTIPGKGSEARDNAIRLAFELANI